MTTLSAKIQSTIARVADSLLSDPNLSDRTKTLYTQILLPFLNEYGRYPASSITRAEVAYYLQGRDHLSYRTQNLHHTVISRLFSHALELNVTDNNPAAHIKRRKPDKRKGESKEEHEFRYLSKSELKELYKRTQHSPRLSALVTLLHESGARIAEVLALDINDLAFEEGHFRVTGKGNRIRRCYFGDKTKKALTHYMKSHREHPHAALFTERSKRMCNVKRLTYHTAYKELREATKDSLALSHVGFHDLRHTFATERAEIVPLETLRALMGHQNIQTTLIYQKITSETAQESARIALKTLAERR
jgi:integrase/recombinase XerD